MGWVQAQISFAILRATNRRIRGLRMKWRSGIGMNDWTELAIIMQ